MRGFFLLFAILTLGLTSPAFPFQAPKLKAPDAFTLKEIQTKTEQLRTALADSTDPDLLIFLKASEYMLRHGEYFGDQAKWTITVLEEGLKRAKRGKLAPQPGQKTVRAYRSRIDDSIQPYALTLPADAENKRYPLHVVLHGRDSNLTETSFLYRHRDKAAPAGLDHVVLEVYGRGNNAYRWAGETDVWEAIEDARKKYDAMLTADIVLRGFSMGGAGTWHIGLHHPDRFRVIGPGAGFTVTKGYAKNLNLTPVQERTLTIYDAVNYAENAAMVPVVAYSGADDPQKAAADNIERALDKLGLKMTHLIAPKTKHVIPPEYQKKLLAEYAKQVAKERTSPDKITFVTYTLKYPSCHWVTITGLEKHYDQARIEADRTGDRIVVQTKNVRRLLLPNKDLTIDGTKLDARGMAKTIELEKIAGNWRYAGRPQPREKKPGLTGPIDDAFTESFLCVRGTGTAWSPALAAYADAELERFQKNWTKYMRGDLRIKDDKDVTREDMMMNNLILFGDPGSNSVLAKLMPRMPVKWSKESFNLLGKDYSTKDQVPVLITPNPLNLNGYVVLNSGHTFHEDAFKGTNALLYPRLGDYAILRVTDAKKPLSAEVVTSGLFDELWGFAPFARQ
jgi:predicted esterase